MIHPPTLRSYILTLRGRPWRSRLLDFLISYARAHIFSVLTQGIHNGNLIIEDDDGVHQFGDPDSKHRSVRLKVVDKILWARILFSLDLGLSEAYMHGDFEVSSLKGLLDLWLDNRHTLSNMSSVVSSAFALYSAVAIKSLGRQSLPMARWNAEVAYNTSNIFYQCFLSKEMTYSCALWGEEENGVRGDLSVGPTSGDLEAAQRRKIHHILTKARVGPNTRLLEIGTGWGSMAIAAARLGCTVDTVTLSKEQMAKAQKNAEAAGVADRIRIHLCDYRSLPASFENCFDAFISCEMVEAVGPKYYHEYFGLMDRALKKDRATAVITATTQPENRYSDYQENDFSRHYHWPNCHLPSATSFAAAIQAIVPGAFVLESIEDHGIHYPRTLREWGRRLDKNFTGDVVKHMQEKYPALSERKNLEAFKKKWEYIFAYAEAGYARAYTSLNCWTFARPENVSTPCD